MKKPIILDTDILNEMDDQFALTYLIALIKEENSKYELQAVTIAPFNPSLHLGNIDYKSAMQLAKQEVLKIFELTNFSCPVFVGSSSYMHETTNYSNEAVDNIIKFVKKSSEKVTIISIGCATNIGMVLAQAPEIANKLDIIWLGGNSFDFVDNYEFNLNQDKQAVNEMLNSSATVTIVPARPVSSALLLSKEVSEKYIKPLGKIGEYLNNLIVDFSKNRKGAGRKLWDIACIYEAFNREQCMQNLKEQKIPAFRIPINYINYSGVQLNNKGDYTINNNNKTTNFVCYLDSEVVLDNMITNIENLYLLNKTLNKE